MVDGHRRKQAEGSSDNPPERLARVIPDLKDALPIEDPFLHSKASDEVEALYDKLYSNHGHTSLLKRNLTPSVFEQLKLLNTKFNGVLADCIRSGKKKIHSITLVIHFLFILFYEYKYDVL